ncbi:MAG TPA: 2-phospho-L-lactate guanylyltransferase [Gaiellaceae bacterium]
MPRVVVPFAGVEGKTRLHASRSVRRALSLAMLGDVVAACVAVGATLVVTPDPDAAAIARDAGADVADDPGGGQGAAVQAALATLAPGPALVVNADVPCVETGDLLALIAATPTGGVGLVEALDGTTNALCLPQPGVFAPLYGQESAARFRARAAELGLDVASVAIPNLADDVDTLDDLERLRFRCGPRTRRCLAELPVEALR